MDLWGYSLSLCGNRWIIAFPCSYNIPYEKIGDKVTELEVPFDIPDSWEWVRFVNLVDYSMGKTPPRKESIYWDNPVHPWASIADMISDGKVTATKEGISAYAAENSFTGRISPAGTLLMSFKLTVGKVSILGIDAYHNEAIISIFPFVDDQRIMTAYLFKILPLISQTGNTKTAIKGNTLNSDSLDNLLIPLPSIAEQKRIVYKLEELAPVLVSYDKAETESKRMENAFPEQLKKSILQWAVQGKLVPQDPSDEPAEALLERIREEKQRLIKEGKIKKDKHESVIFRRDNSHYEKLREIEYCIDDEIPFEIPEPWAWCKVKNFANVVSARRVHQADWKTNGVPFYRAREIAKLAENGFVDNDLFISEALYNDFSGSGIPKAGDLMITAVGTLGKVYIVKPTDRFYYKDASVICFEMFGNISSEYLKYVMESPYMEELIKENSAGTTVGTITIVKANEYWIPLPPPAEQQRIVDKIKELMPIIQTL